MKKFIPGMHIGGINNGGNEMCLDKILQVVHGEYKVICNRKELDNTENLNDKIMEKNC